MVAYVAAHSTVQLFSSLKNVRKKVAIHCYWDHHELLSFMMIYNNNEYQLSILHYFKEVNYVW